MSADPQPEIREKQPFLRERREDAIREAPRAWIDLPRSTEDWAQLTLWAVGPGLVLGVIGPFGSFGAPIAVRLAYWVPTMAIGVLFGWFISAWAERQSWLDGRRWARVALVSLIMTGLMMGVVVGWGHVVFGANVVPVSLTLAFYVWVVGIAMSGVGHLFGQAQAAKPAPLESPTSEPAVAASARPQALSQRLKPGVRNATILALEAEDHYVRVHTAQGSELILIRLADAISEMGDVEGARTHRSWWVARAAVREARRSDGRATLTLSNGAQAPVSRNALAELVEKGWL